MKGNEQYFLNNGINKRYYLDATLAPAVMIDREGERKIIEHQVMVFHDEGEEIIDCANELKAKYHEEFVHTPYTNDGISDEKARDLRSCFLGMGYNFGKGRRQTGKDIIIDLENVLGDKSVLSAYSNNKCVDYTERGYKRVNEGSHIASCKKLYIGKRRYGSHIAVGEGNYLCATLLCKGCCGFSSL